MFGGSDIMTWIGLAAVLVAVVAVLFALRLAIRENSAGAKWKAKAIDLDQRLGDIDSVLGAYPGLILVWDDKGTIGSGDWGDPRVLGSTAALASIIRFSEKSTKSKAARILDGIADLDTISESADSKPLRYFIQQLRTDGAPFSISIVLPEGNVIEADGRVAGRKVVLWLEDASIRGEDERTAITRFENSRILSETDPIAFIEMMGRAPFPLWRMNSTGKINWVNNAYVEAVGASDVRDVTSNQIYLDQQAADDTQRVLSASKPFESTRNIVLGGDRRATTIALFPVNGGVAGIATDAEEKVDLRERLQQHVNACLLYTSPSPRD